MTSPKRRSLYILCVNVLLLFVHCTFRAHMSVRPRVKERERERLILDPISSFFPTTPIPLSRLFPCLFSPLPQQLPSLNQYVALRKMGTIE